MAIAALERPAPTVEASTPEREPIINDFSIQVATTNGSGSQTANSALLRALFKMGIPVGGKNTFPSNIQGLPTWYTIRASKRGFTARRENAEIVVLMNKATAAEDLSKVRPDGVCFYADDIRIDEAGRPDVTYYPMPVKKLTAEAHVEPSLKNYVANMVYVGVVAQMMGIEVSEIEAALNYHFRNKAKAVKVNMDVVTAAAAWARANLTKADPFRVERMDATEGHILIDGNTAGALGAIFGGLTFAAWYPITPATSLADALNEYLPKLRSDAETETPTYAVVQAEDELAALGMVIGAGWAGARALTSTSGPGISLMTEFAGLGYYAEVPAVIWDIQRMGPSTGLPTRVSQGDVLSVYFLGHGDTQHVVLLPGSATECFDFGWRAFDLAEQLQTPVFVLSDLDLGMNQWMSYPFEYPTEPMKRGKVLSAQDVERMRGFARYKDVDGDGIGWRTLPGTDNPRAAYFARGTGHDERAVYSERADDWEHNMERLGRKFETARALVPDPVVHLNAGAQIGLMGFGSADPPLHEARHRLRQAGLETSYLRLRALPLNHTVRDFLALYDRVYVIELNTQGQLANLIQMEYPELATKVISLAHSDGLPLSARWITAAVQQQER